MRQPRSVLFYPPDNHSARYCIDACVNRTVIDYDWRQWLVREWECLPPDGKRIVCHLEEITPCT